MKKILLETGWKDLAEASRRDRVWGIGYNECEAEGRRKMWGQNLLGRCLQDVRWRIGREEECGRFGGEWDGEIEAGVSAGWTSCGIEEEEEVIHKRKEEGEIGAFGTVQ